MNIPVYVVVSYEAADDAEVSLFWYDVDQRDRAIRRMMHQYRRGILNGRKIIVRTLRVAVPDGDDEITDLLNEKVDVLTDTLPAVAQLVPPLSDPFYSPVGGTRLRAVVDEEEDEPPF